MVDLGLLAAYDSCQRCIMPDFSSTIPDTHVRVSSDFMETLIQDQRKKLFTGLMRLHYGSGENFVLSFLEGAPQQLYHTREEYFEILPQQSLSTYLHHAEISVGLLDLSPDALRVMRMAQEAPIIKSKVEFLSVKDLSNQAEKWVLDTFPSIIYTHSESVSKLYLIAGYSTPIVEELSFEGNKAHFSINGVSFPNSLPPTEYQVTRYLSDNQLDIWQEYELRFAFNSLMHMLITRFSELAGRILTERLCMQLSSWIIHGGWKISVTTNGLANHHYFESLADAKHAYLEILRSFHGLAGEAIGSRLINAFANQSLLKLNPHHQTLLQRHLYDLDDFENAATRAGGQQS
jgi:hypothetical protein